MAVATLASCFPSSRRSGTAAAPRRGTGRQAAPSVPVTTTTSPGRAPARPGTRSARPSAVTRTTLSARVVSPPRTGTTALAPEPVELEYVLELYLGRHPSETSSAPVSPEAARSLAGLTAAAVRAELAPAQDRSGEVDALDERVLRHDEPVDDGSASCSIPCASPRRSSLREEPELPELVKPGHSSEIARARRACRDRAPRARRRAVLEGPGPSAPGQASSAATPSAASASAAASSGSS